jgi:hypothetical protein
MSALVFNLVTAALMVLMLRVGLTLVDPETFRSRPRPWVAVTLVALAVAGLIVQHTWPGAMAALDSDPSRSGWWRPLTSVFLQNGGVLGDTWNLVTLAALAAMAEWFWGRTLTVALFLCAVVLPEALDLVAGAARSTDPRNFAGSSGATYFLAATLAGAALLLGPHSPQRLLASAVPAVGLAAWLTQQNGHGLVSTEGFALGALLWLALHRRLTFNRIPPAALHTRQPSPTSDDQPTPTRIPPLTHHTGRFTKAPDDQLTSSTALHTRPPTPAPEDQLIRTHVRPPTRHTRQPSSAAGDVPERARETCPE